MTDPADLSAPYALALLRTDEIGGNEILRQIEEMEDPIESLKQMTGGLVAIIRHLIEDAGHDPAEYMAWLCQRLYEESLDVDPST